MMKTLKEVEEEYMTLVLDSVKGNRTKAAKILGISLRTCRYFANKLNRWQSDHAEISQKDKIFMKKVSAQDRDKFENIDKY